MTSSSSSPRHHYPTRMLMRDWLLQQIDDGAIPGLEWLDDSKTLIKIPWVHGSKSVWSRDHHCKLFENWAIYTGMCRVIISTAPTGGALITFVPLLVCLSVREQDYAKCFQAIFVKHCRIIDYFYVKDRLNFGADHTGNGRMEANF